MYYNKNIITLSHNFSITSVIMSSMNSAQKLVLVRMVQFLGSDNDGSCVSTEMNVLTTQSPSVAKKMNFSSDNDSSLDLLVFSKSHQSPMSSSSSFATPIFVPKKLALLPSFKTPSSATTTNETALKKKTPGTKKNSAKKPATKKPLSSFKKPSKKNNFVSPLKGLCESTTNEVFGERIRLKAKYFHASLNDHAYSFRNHTMQHCYVKQLKKEAEKVRHLPLPATYYS